MNFLGMGSGWWSVAGQSADFVGFIVLTIDLYPEVAATRIRRLAQNFRDTASAELSKASADHWNRLSSELRDRIFPGIADLPDHADTLEKVDDIVNRARPPSGLTPDDQAKLREHRVIGKGLNKAVEVGYVDLEAGFLDVHETHRGVDFVVPSPALRQSARETLQATNVLVLRLLLALMPSDKHSPLDTFRGCVRAVNGSVGRFGSRMQTRWRPPLWVAVALILGGFAAQAWGSIPLDEPWRFIPIPDPWP